MAFTALLHVEDPGCHDGVHDFDGEADGTVELVRDAGLNGAGVGVHEAGAVVAFGELFHHEVGHDGAVGESCVEGEVVAEVEVVDADFTLGAGGEDAVDSAELAGVGGGGKIGHELDDEAHASVVVDGHFLVKAFVSFRSAS